MFLKKAEENEHRYNNLIEKNIDVLLEEYDTLRKELMQFFSMQQHNSVQTFVIVGALLLYVGSNWGKTSNKNLILCALLLGIPIFCFGALLSGMGVFARGRQIGYYISILENKITNLLLQSEHSVQAMEWHNWYAKDNNDNDRIVCRLDLAPVLILFLLLPIVSAYLGYIYVDKDIKKIYGFFIVIFIFFIILLIFALKILSFIKSVNIKIVELKGEKHESRRKKTKKP